MAVQDGLAYTPFVSSEIVTQKASSSVLSIVSLGSLVPLSSLEKWEFSMPSFSLHANFGCVQTLLSNSLKHGVN